MAGIIHKDDIRHPSHPQYAGIAKPAASQKPAAETSADEEAKAEAAKTTIPKRNSNS